MTADGLDRSPARRGPAGPTAEQLQLFGQFIGSWDIAWAGLDAEGRTRHGARRAALRLGARRPRGAGHLDRSRSRRARRGTAAARLPRLDDPLLRRRARRLALDLDRSRQRPRAPLHRARRSEGEILLLSDEDDPQLRWRFTDIRRDAFTWRGEISRDGGATCTRRRGDADHPQIGRVATRLAA